MRTGLAALLLLAVAPTGALAGESAGQVLFALGRVEVVRAGQTIAATRGTALEVGDTITTGPTGLTQLRFKDGALLALRSGSSMTVEAYRLPPGAAVPTPALAPKAAYTAQPATASTPVATGGGGLSILRLARGAFRTITGLIGKAAGDDYRVVTPAATIGIRGTDYTAAYCESGTCSQDQEGLYVGVSSGEVVVSNDSGALNLGDNEYAHVENSNTPPTQELAPPEVLETPIAPQGEEGGEAQGGEPAPEGGGAGGEESTTGSGDTGTTDTGTSDTGGGETTPAPEYVETGISATSTTQIEAVQPNGTYELLPGLPGSYAWAAAGFKGRDDNGVYTDGSDAFIGFLTIAFTSIGDSANANQGFDYATGLRWGRWDGGTTGGGTASIDTTNNPLHWIYAYQDAPVMPVSGTLSYTLVGNTDPTDSVGSKPGFLGSATFSANFTNQSVASTLNLGINNQVWQASGSGSISGSLFNGSYSVNVNNAAGSPLGTGSGAFNGFFTDQAAGAGLTYSLTAVGTTVSGAAAFGP